MKRSLFLWLSWSVLFARALEEQTCLLSSDGSCLPDDDLPPVVDEYMDVGFGDKQQVTGSQEARDATMQQMREMLHYMKGTVMTDPSFAEVKDECGNRNELCVYWVSKLYCKSHLCFAFRARTNSLCIHSPARRHRSENAQPIPNT